MIALNKVKCVGCGKCAEVCPTEAIYLVEKEVFVKKELCRSCGACVEVCPKGAVTLNISAVQDQSMVEFMGNHAMRSMSIRRPFGGGRGERRRLGRRGC